MRILHTADLHIGQIIYQHYGRNDEHLHFFHQLEKWIKEYEPDLLVVAGDIFDMPQPSASCWKMFTETFVSIRKLRQDMAIVIIAGNHDSASRLQSHSEIWALADTYIIGSTPPLNFREHSNWEEKFILRLPKGYVIALPYMSSDKADAVIALQEYVEKENTNGLPVVMTGHLAVTGCDFTGHDSEIGMLRTIDIERFGTGYDYFALGHIHRPQTIKHYPSKEVGDGWIASPVSRYSGSALHVSCDEAFPHSVTLVDIDAHKKKVKIRELRIQQLRHFYNLPLNKEAFNNEKEVFKYLVKFIDENESCYIRIKMEKGADLPSDFNNRIYAFIEESGKDIRYNPKIIWIGDDEEEKTSDDLETEIAVEDFQQMTDPLEFIRLTADRYPALDMSTLPSAFKEIAEELMLMQEEEASKNLKSRKAQ
ncbi:MAG: exonuclease SbcCD subunit D [Muribaculaceae bacterium]|nr:exonuclease SbcCD subunit D [Muribaculaceae bacterium]